METKNERIEVVRYLNELRRFGRKSFEWWDDSAFQLMISNEYLKVESFPEHVLVGIRCHEDKWFRVTDVVKFLSLCRKAWGKDAPILKANIVSDKRQILYLVWREERQFWSECEEYLHATADLEKSSAKVIQMRVNDVLNVKYSE